MLDITVSCFGHGARPDQETACIRELSCFLEYKWTWNSLQHNKQLHVLTSVPRTRHEDWTIQTFLYTNDCITSGRGDFSCQLHHSFSPEPFHHAASHKLLVARRKKPPLCLHLWLSSVTRPWLMTLLKTFRRYSHVGEASGTSESFLSLHPWLYKKTNNGSVDSGLKWITYWSLNTCYTSLSGFCWKYFNTLVLFYSEIYTDSMFSSWFCRKVLVSLLWRFFLKTLFPVPLTEDGTRWNLCFSKRVFKGAIDVILRVIPQWLADFTPCDSNAPKIWRGTTIHDLRVLPQWSVMTTQWLDINVMK